YHIREWTCSDDTCARPGRYRFLPGRFGSTSCVATGKILPCVRAKPVLQQHPLSPRYKQSCSCISLVKEIQRFTALKLEQRFGKTDAYFQVRGNLSARRRSSVSIER